MKRARFIHTAACFLALGIIGPVEARQDKPEKQREKAKPEKQEKQDKPEKQEAKAPKQEQPDQAARQQEDKSAKQSQQQEKSVEKQQSSNSARHQQQAQAQHEQPAKTEKQRQAKTSNQERQANPEAQQQSKSGEQTRRQQQAGSSNPPQRTEQAEARQRAAPALRLSERGSGRIPDDRFRSNFGREHRFRIGEPVMVGGYSRFQYGGFWFGFVEPWPSGWYYTDDVYIDYVDGGYYMYDPYYPGARFAISVVI